MTQSIIPIPGSWEALPRTCAAKKTEKLPLPPALSLMLQFHLRKGRLLEFFICKPHAAEALFQAGEAQRTGSVLPHPMATICSADALFQVLPTENTGALMASAPTRS